MTIEAGAQVFSATTSCKLLDVIHKEGIRYGSSIDKRTKCDRHALADIDMRYRVPVKLLYHFQVSLGDQVPFTCSVIQQCASDDKIPAMPWDLQ